MKNGSLVIAGVALALAVASSAFAQSDDAKYCASLGATYDKYVQTSGSRGARLSPNASVDEAKTKCQSDAKSAIPVLEGVLKDAKVDLPAHG